MPGAHVQAAMYNRVVIDWNSCCRRQDKPTKLTMLLPMAPGPMTGPRTDDEAPCVLTLPGGRSKPAGGRLGQIITVGRAEAGDAGNGKAIIGNGFVSSYVRPGESHADWRWREGQFPWPETDAIPATEGGGPGGDHGRGARPTALGLGLGLHGAVCLFGRGGVGCG